MGAPALYIADAGCGRLRRPPSRPSCFLAELESQISVGKVAEPGNWKIEAGSATAGALCDMRANKLGGHGGQY